MYMCFYSCIFIIFLHAVHFRIRSKKKTLVSTDMAMSAIDGGINSAEDSRSQSIPTDSDAPEYAEIGQPDVTTIEELPVLAEKEPKYTYATAGIPFCESSPRYYELPRNATRVMFVANDDKPSQGYTSVDEAGIQIQGAYSTMRHQ